VDFFLNFFDKKFGRLKTSRIFVPELKIIIMSDKKTVNEELAMEYSPILGVTYGLVNVTPENEDSEEERDELHDFDMVMNHIVGDLDEEEKKD
jgi:hypothetical protein